MPIPQWTPEAAPRDPALFDDIFELWDPYIVARTDPSWPEPVFYGKEGAEKLWDSVRANLG